ncbi:N-acetyl-gamma-glutamyl-phosphate reductase [Vibrio ezurae]|uniref:N-acetyl-gamma-glutamyl-phosphate reductase n=1 Tax=Vibrio ezurae NBRC 102218 TaxID=1219080 RepID=U3CH80_9VIBR|nr:N-acetyl-gamma-glutamyl-phosphate reductase [Vibrio ezurae]GAD80569.1 N-acetyl-gamma-glutamyl-phosphate reductase [Vibrio ezurae NBRC 102218]
MINEKQLKVAIIGASGYTGAELANMVLKHPSLTLSGLYVSANSLDANKPISQLHGKLLGKIDMPLLPLNDVDAVAQQADIVFLATAHQVSHDLAPVFLKHSCQVFDLSGAYRVQGDDFYTQYYGFEHEHLTELEQAVYGLAEWNKEQISQTDLVAVAGCYPTASQLAIKPIIEAGLLDSKQWPVINAVSGVSGAGIKASKTNSFCEVSLQAYGVFTHRHQPEISNHLGQEVIFTPHLGNFKRGILATITLKLADNVSAEQVEQVFTAAYSDAELVRLKHQDMPKIQDVEYTPFCDIGWKVQGQHLIVVSAIDNLLKGASAQAMQCLNIRNQFPETTALF